MLLINMDKVRDALAFAKEKHGAINQRRGSADLPYIVHPYAVTTLVFRYQSDFGNHLEDSLIAGALHDTVEDAFVQIRTIIDMFGFGAAKMVAAMTKNPLILDKHASLKDSLDRCEAIGPHCLALKNIDRIENLNPITMPVKWSLERRKEYVSVEAQAILERGRKVGLRDTSNRLENAMDIFKKYIE